MDETRFLMQELLASLSTCPDLSSALRCLHELLCPVVAIQDLILLVRTPESPHVKCISSDGSFQVSEFSEEQLKLDLPSVVAPDVVDSRLPCIASSIGQLPANGQIPCGFSTKVYNLFPLQGLGESFVALGVLFSGRQAEAAHTVFLQQLAVSLGISIDNVILRERIGRLRGALTSSLSHAKGLRAISQTSITQETLQDLIDGVSADVRSRFGTEILCLLRYRPDSEDMLWAAMHFPNGRGPHVVGTTTSVVQTHNGGTVAIKTQRPVLADRNMLEQTSNENCIATLLSLKAKTYYAVPLIYGGLVIGVLSPAHVKKSCFTSEEISLWDDCAGQISLALKCLTAEGSIGEVANTPASSCYEVLPRNKFPGLVGNSPALRSVLSLVEVVAPTDSAVLLTGETGTGKGLIAEALHRLSNRRMGPLVVINCSAIPVTLLESEMFGHERGAFTGAIARRIGRLEQANGGTVFFDEIGELPLELQPKLLRAIQEQRIERLGGNTSIQLDVRFIWATNRNLEQMVRENHFRSDLYYRISVFPISVPALAQRRDDIETLSYHFLQECNRKMKKNIERISVETMNTLQGRDWPGNIRELQNVIERAAILSTGRTLELPREWCPAELSRPTQQPSSQPEVARKTWEEIERDYLVQALRETDGVIAKAAARLNLKRTTLDSRIRRLGITQLELSTLRAKSNSEHL
jgi:formate hydrogenlyase transcriptional activator